MILSGAVRMVLEGREVDLVEEGKETAAVTAAAMVEMMVVVVKRGRLYQWRKRETEECKYYGLCFLLSFWGG